MILGYEAFFYPLMILSALIYVIGMREEPAIPVSTALIGLFLAVVSTEPDPGFSWVLLFCWCLALIVSVLRISESEE